MAILTATSLIDIFIFYAILAQNPKTMFVKIWRPTSLFFVSALLVSCGVSKEELTQQLQNHVKAYRSINVTTGNYLSIIKSANLLLNKSETNSFAPYLTPQDSKTIKKALESANTIQKCLADWNSISKASISESTTKEYLVTVLNDAKSYLGCKSLLELTEKHIHEAESVASKAKKLIEKHDKEERQAKEKEALGIRGTCDITNFDQQCAHGMEADAARNYKEAVKFADGNLSEICFGNYSMYYKNTCTLIGRGHD